MVNRLLECSFEVIHGFEDVKHFLFTDTKTFVSFCLTFGVLGINRHIQASLMEIRSCFPVIEFFKLLRYFQILVEALLDLITLFLIGLSLLEVVTESEERLLGLLETGLAGALVQSLLLLQLHRGLDLRGGRVRCDVEEVHVRLQVTLLQEPDAFALCSNLLFELEVVLLSSCEVLTRGPTHCSGVLHELLACSLLL